MPDLRSNALLLSANVHLFPQILKLIEDLDAPTAQVLIEARILEVSSDALDKIGVRWSPDGSRVAYDVGMEGERSLFVLEPERSTEPTAVLANLDPPVVDINAYAWAPDGEHLAVVAGREDPSAEPLGPGAMTSPHEMMRSRVLIDIGQINE